MKVSIYLGWSGLAAATAGSYLVNKTTGDPVGCAMVTYAVLSLAGFAILFRTEN